MWGAKAERNVKMMTVEKHQMDSGKWRAWLLEFKTNRWYYEIRT